MVLMKIVNGCRHFLEKKSQHNFLIAFLMILVLFANGPKWELLMGADIFWKKNTHKKSAQFLIAFLMMLVLFANGPNENC